MDSEELILLAIEDVTQRIDAEEIIRGNETRLRLATEATGMGTWDLHFKTGKLIWNDQNRAIFGLPQDAEITESIFYDMIHPDDRPIVLAEDHRVRRGETNGDYLMDFRCIRRDGQIRWISTKGRMFFDENKVPVRSSAPHWMSLSKKKRRTRCAKAKRRCASWPTPRRSWSGRPIQRAGATIGTGSGLNTRA